MSSRSTRSGATAETPHELERASSIRASGIDRGTTHLSRVPGNALGINVGIGGLLGLTDPGPSRPLVSEAAIGARLDSADLLCHITCKFCVEEERCRSREPSGI
jgi:hypothetical protein